MNTEEGNKIIAEFMGAKVDGTSVVFKLPPCSLWLNERQTLFHVDDIRFDRDWSWLMPVVKKIKSVIDNLQDEDITHLRIYALSSLFTPNEIVWEWVIEFIQWHNLNLKT